jgi:hypothetical protein
VLDQIKEDIRVPVYYAIQRRRKDFKHTKLIGKTVGKQAVQLICQLSARNFRYLRSLKLSKLAQCSGSRHFLNLSSNFSNIINLLYTIQSFEVKAAKRAIWAVADKLGLENDDTCSHL